MTTAPMEDPKTTGLFIALWFGTAALTVALAINTGIIVLPIFTAWVGGIISAWLIQDFVRGIKRRKAK